MSSFLNLLNKLLPSEQKDRQRADTIQLLIEQKYRYVQTIAQISMLWWVSTIVFAGGAIYGAIQFQDWMSFLQPWQRATVVLLLIGILFVNVVYAFFALLGTWSLKSDIEQLLHASSLPKNLGSLREFRWTIFALLNAILGFLLMIVLCALIGMWGVVSPLHTSAPSRCAPLLSTSVAGPPSAMRHTTSEQR